MKLFGIQAYEQGKNVNFEGKRINHNIVAQLAKNNPYSINDPNARLITNAITELGKVAGEKNIKFLMDVAAKNTYSTNIKLKDAPLRNWKEMVLAAATGALALTHFLNKKAYTQKIEDIANQNELSETEKQILAEREKLLSAVDLEQIKKETVGGIADFERNLDYFVVSSETTKEHKKYVLERLNYMMSDEYKINPQLKDKKSIVVAEMINDMAIATPGHKIPNIKAVNQKHHGMCAAISIVRKKLAYEDKPNYVDSILSELDDKDVMSVYDRTKLGSGIKVEVQKVPVDFNAAMNKGYRIIDASTMHWMQIAKMSGYSNGAYNIYNPFDDENFDVKRDSFFNAQFYNSDLVPMQLYYQALIKTKQILEEYKAKQIKNAETAETRRQNSSKNIEQMSETKQLLTDKISKLGPNIYKETIIAVVNDAMKLEKKYSDKISDSDIYSYIVNEEDIMKQAKVVNYIKSQLPSLNIDEKQAGEIYSLVKYYHELESELQINDKTINSRLDDAEALYNIAAAFRYQFLMSLEDSYTLDDLIHAEKIPDKETLMLDLADKYISKLKKNTPDAERIRKHFEVVFDGETPTNDDVIEFLETLKVNIQSIITTGFDNLYAAMTMGDRKGSLLTYLESIIQTIESDDKALSIDLVASRLGVAPKKKDVIKALNVLKERVETGDEKSYSEAYNKVGNASQSEFLKNVYEDFIAKLSAEDNKEFVTRFLAVHNLPIEDNEQVAMGVINSIGENVNTVTGMLDAYATILTIKDENDDILYSPEPKDVVIKNFEDSNIVISAKKLRELKTHFDKILKDKSSDEFNSRQGKLKDKSLYEFSNSEEETLAFVKHNINPYYAQVQKTLTSVRQEMKQPLEELSRIVGINEGHWWVSSEGSSGLYGNNQVRVLEYMTGRPHYETSDLKDAIERIKNSPFSGISSSSVFHHKDGWHAQYIADIAPVTVKTKDGKEETKEVLFHDNTWGASERENTWVDSYGLIRTDYSDNRGGSLGYITNDKFRNGNFVDRILGDMVKINEDDEIKSHTYKRLTHLDKDPWYSPQYPSVILQGESPELFDLADDVRDKMFVPTIRLANLVSIFAPKTQQEIKAAIKRVDLAEEAYKPLYNSLISRIVPQYGPETDKSPRFMSLEEYNNLADDDILKIALEVMALQRNYDLPNRLADLSEVKNVKELEKFRQSQIRRATNDLKYTFGKDDNLIEYLAESFNQENEDTIISILSRHGIKLSDEELATIIDKLVIDKDKFNGSLKNTIDDIMTTIANNINSIIKDKNARNELKYYIRRIIKDRLYFNEKDLDNRDIEHVIKFIDRVYDPADNEQFIKIFRNIQDMPTETFQKLVLSKATPEDLGIKSETGYDILRKIQRYEQDIQWDFLNTIWRREFYSAIPKEQVLKQEYYFNKLNRRQRHLSRRNFETTYREMKNSLEHLNYQKLFNKYKNGNLEKYGAYPAYPNVDNGLLGENMYKTSWDICFGDIEEKVFQITATKNVEKMFTSLETLKKIVKDVPDNHILTESEYKDLNYMLGHMVTTLYGDNVAEGAYNAAEDLMEIPQGAEFAQYKTGIKTLVDKLEKYKKNFEGDSFDSIKTVNKILIDKQKEIFVKTLIQKRYQAKIMEMVNKYERALIRKDPNAEKYKGELWEAYKQYHMLRNPKELLATYLESLAEDTDLKQMRENLQTLVKRALNYARLIEVQSILMDALSKGVETEVKNAFDKFKLDLYEGGLVSMAEDDVISQIVYMLIIDEQEETARMFLEKFGLNEVYVLHTAKSMKYENIKSKIDEAAQDYDNFSKFSEDYERLFDELSQNLSESKDIIKELDKFKRNIGKTAKANKIDKPAIKEFMLKIDNLKNYLLEHPGSDAKALAQSTIPNAMAEVAGVEQERWKEVNDILTSYEVICNLANKVAINPDTEAYAVRTEMNKKFDELTEYAKKVNGMTDDLPEEE